MKKIIYQISIIAWVIVSFFSLAKIQEHEIKLDKLDSCVLSYNVVHTVSSTVVYIEAAGQWSGSGVIVGKDCVLTARHIAKGAENLTIKDCYDNVYEVINSILDDENDCALLFIEGSFKNVAKLGDSDELKVGEQIFAIGSPFGETFYNEVCSGIISGINRDLDYFGKENFITSDMDGNPGNSGCPVFNLKGEVIGILIGGVDYSGYGNPIGIIVPIKTVFGMEILNYDLPTCVKSGS